MSVKHNSPKRKNKTQKVKSGLEPEISYSKEDYNSNNGMLTTVWGPGMWHYLHTMSFNYPVEPTKTDKRHYRDFILQLQYVLPCGKCRKNLVRNFKRLPLTAKDLESREMFSKYIYNLHEVVNKMLGKKSGLSYDDVRIRYEHFRARCANDSSKQLKGILSQVQHNKTQKNHVKFAKNASIIKERGCTEPIYGKKSKCVIQIVPQETKCETFQMDKECEKTKIPIPITP